MFEGYIDYCAESPLGSRVNDKVNILQTIYLSHLVAEFLPFLLTLTGLAQ